MNGEVNNQWCEESRNEFQRRRKAAAAISHLKSQRCCTRKRKRVLYLSDEKMEKVVQVTGDI